MSTNVPEPPPYGALIEDAREKAGLSKREAARRAGISDAWWRYLVRGYQKTPGDLNAPADTIARMARAVGLSPERLEEEGQRSDAAEILREILRSEPPVPPPPPAPAAGPLAMPGVDPADAAAAERIYPGDLAAQALLLGGDLPGLDAWLKYRRDRAANGYPEDRRNGATG